MKGDHAVTDDRTLQQGDDDAVRGLEHQEESELTDEDLEGVAGDGFSFTHPIDKPSPILYQG
jgi:type VI protein secretion system component Hcp